MRAHLGRGDAVGFVLALLLVLFISWVTYQEVPLRQFFDDLRGIGSEEHGR